MPVNYDILSKIQNREKIKQSTPTATPTATPAVKQSTASAVQSMSNRTPVSTTLPTNTKKESIFDKIVGGTKYAIKNLTAKDAPARLGQAVENMAVGAGKGALGTVKALDNLGSKVSGVKSNIDLAKVVFPKLYTGEDKVAQKVGEGAYKVAETLALGGAGGASTEAYGATGGAQGLLEASKANKGVVDTAKDVATGTVLGVLAKGAEKLAGKALGPVVDKFRKSQSIKNEVSALKGFSQNATKSAEDTATKYAEKSALRSSINEGKQITTLKGTSLRSGAENSVLRSGKSSSGAISNEISKVTQPKIKTGILDEFRTEKGYLRKFGKIGNDIADRVESFESQTAVKVSKTVNKFTDVLKSVKSGTGMAVKDVEKKASDFIVRYDYARTAGTPKPSLNELDPSTRKVVESFFKDVTGEASTIAKNEGIYKGNVDLFMPHVPKDIKKFQEAYAQDLLKEGLSPDQVILKVGKAVEDIKSRKFAGFENKRFFNPKSVDDLERYGFETDLTKIADRWSRNAWRRVLASVHFGGKDYTAVKEGIAKMVSEGQIPGRMTKEGAVIPAGEAEKFAEVFNRIVSGRKVGTDSTEAFYKATKSALSTNIGITSGIKQPLSLAQTSAVAGFRNLSRGIRKTIGIASTSPRDKEVIRNAGVILNRIVESNIKGTDAEVASVVGGRVSNIIDKVADVNSTLSGVPVLDKAMRKISAYAGLDWVESSMKKLASGKLSTKEASILRGRIKDFAIPIDSKIEQIIAKGGAMTDDELSVAVNKFVEKTQFGAQRSNLPHFFNATPLGELTSVLRTYSYEQASFLSKLASNAKNRGDYAPLAKYLASVGITSVPVAVLTSMAKGSFENFKNTLFNIAGDQLLGVVTNSFMYPDNIGGGVAESEAVNAIKAVKGTVDNIKNGKENPTKPAQRYLYKKTLNKVPYYGPKGYEALYGKNAGKKKLDKTTK